MTGHRSPLKPRARLMQHLGADLIPNDRVALIELIKNSYDADASLVVLRLRHTDGVGTIELWDDGHGMSEETVASNWLEIANPNRKTNPRSESGRRRVLGAKGLGRFAVARLANTTELTTRRTSDSEVYLSVNWDDFDDDSLFLEDIQIGWGVRETPIVFGPDGEAANYFAQIDAAVSPNSDTYSEDSEPERDPADTGIERDRRGGAQHGTLLRLSPVRGTWDEKELRVLTTALGRLVPPLPPQELGVSAVPEFQIVLDLDDNAEPEVVGPSPTITKPAYRLLGRIDRSGHGALSFTTTRDAQEKVVTVSYPEVENCGPLAVDLRVWDLEAGALTDLRQAEGANTREVRALIREASGVAIYRDGFRVQPYGDPDVDWLGLDGRRVNNPTMRLSNNQLVGFIFTAADDNPDLRDQANRQGLIENDALDALREVMRKLLNEIEQQRYRIRRELEPGPVAVERAGGLFAAFSLEDLRETVAVNYPGDSRLHRAVDEAQASLERGVENVQEVVSRFSRLSTLGSLTDVMLHEGNTTLASINYLILELEDRVEDGSSEGTDVLGPFIPRLQTQVDVLARLFRNLEPLSGRRRGRPRRVHLLGVLQQAVAVLDGELSTTGVELELSGVDRVVTLDLADVIQIVVNLVRNAIYWVSTTRAPGERRIVVHAGGDPESVTIQVSDNGPGVPDSQRDLIFDTYYTTRPDGVGLGLNIAGSIAADFYDGELALISNGPLPGATFQATLRRRI